MDLMMMLHPLLLQNHDYDKIMMAINSNNNQSYCHGRVAYCHEGNNTRAGATRTPAFSSVTEEKPSLYERIRRDVMTSYPTAGPLRPRPSFPREGSFCPCPSSNYDNKKRHYDCLIPGQFGHAVQDKKIDNVSSLSSYSLTEERKGHETKRRKMEIEGQNQQGLNPAARRWSRATEYPKQEQLGRKDEARLEDDELQVGAFLLLCQKQKNQRGAGMEDLSSSYAMNNKAKTTQYNTLLLKETRSERELEKDSSSVTRFAYIHRSDSIVDIHKMSHVDYSATISP